MNQVEKAAKWAKHIEDYRCSGLTAVQWCEQNGLSVHVLRSWITRLNKAQKKQSNNPEWIAIKPSTSNSSSHLVVNIGRATIQIPPGFNIETFRQVIQVLAEQC